MIKKRSTSGFTLVETIIYIAIIGAVTTSFVSFGISITNSRNKNFATQEVQANSRVVLGFITKQIRRADGIIGPTTGDSSSTLRLDMPGDDPNLFFYIEDGVLKMMQGSGTTTAITSSQVRVDNIEFHNYSVPGKRGNMGIFFTINYAQAEQDKEVDYAQTLRTAVSIRN